MRRRVAGMIFAVLTLTLSSLATTASGQESKVESLRKKAVTYYWTGKTCPTFRNPEQRFGFKVECTGCTITKKIRRNNRRVVKVINSVYGKDWFEQNKQYL